MGIKGIRLAGLMALCLGVSSLAAADGIYVKRDSMGREIGQLLYIDTDFGAITEVTTCAYKNGEPPLTDVAFFSGNRRLCSRGHLADQGCELHRPTGYTGEGCFLYAGAKG